jgi:hypothetical protein
MSEGKNPDLSFHNDRGNQWKDVDEALALWRVVGSGLQKLLCDPVAKNSSTQGLILETERLLTLVRSIGKRRQKVSNVYCRKEIQSDGSQLSPESPMVDTPTVAHSVAIPERQWFKIGEVSEMLDVEPYVLRYRESEFKILKPTRTRARQRLYHKKDLEKLGLIKHLSCDEKMSVSSIKKRLRKVYGEEILRELREIIDSYY